MKDRAAAYMKENLGLELRKKRYTNLQGGIGAVLSHGIDFAIYGILGYYVLQGALSMGSFSLAIGNIALFREYFGKISDTLVGYSDTAKYMEYYNRFMVLESRFRKAGRERVRISADDSFDIAFRDV